MPPTESEPAIFMNLSVNQKAVYQPTFRFRRWLESQKVAVPDGKIESMANIETRLPPLRGPSSNMFRYVDELKKVEARLLDFYTRINHLYEQHK